MNCFIRTDASSLIGSGHVMRCLTLANELQNRRAGISFICRKDSGNLIQLIEARGFQVYALPVGINTESDRKLTQSILTTQSVSPDWVVVDHYELDRTYEAPLRKIVKHIMVIDDFENRYHDCDLLLNQNYNSNFKRYEDFVPAHCAQLLGPEYALLRPQFRKAREHLYRQYHTVKRIFIFLGGADPNNETCKVLRAIRRLKRPDIAVDVIIGASNPHRQEIETFVSQMLFVTYHRHVENMAKLMAAADIGIGAAGTTTWERCCLGLPSIVLILAENQRDIAENLDKDEIVKNLGYHDTVTEVDIYNAIENLIRHPDERRNMSLQSQELVDGQGTARVVKSMLELGGMMKFVNRREQGQIDSFTMRSL